MPRKPPTEEELQDLVKRTKEFIKSSDLQAENLEIIKVSKLAEMRRVQNKKVDPSLFRQPFVI